MISLGCDVGTRTGLAVIDVPKRSCLYRAVVSPGEVPLAVREVLGRWPVDIVGIETPSQVFTHGRAKGDMGARIGIERALLVARDVAGVIRGVVTVLRPEVPIVDGQAHEVRKIVGKIRRGTADKAVRAFVHGALPDWPPGKGDNDHARDAAVAALWAPKHQMIAQATTPKRAKRSA